jgi:hypothetical protein
LFELILFQEVRAIYFPSSCLFSHALDDPMVARAKQSLVNAVSDIRDQLQQTQVNCDEVDSMDMIPALIATSKTLKAVKAV